MSLVEKSTTVNVPVKTAYNQWTQFEEFPKFMESVVSVQQLDAKQMRWHTNIGGVDQEFLSLRLPSRFLTHVSLGVAGAANDMPGLSPSIPSTITRVGSCCRWNTSRTAPSRSWATS